MVCNIILYIFTRITSKYYVTLCLKLVRKEIEAVSAVHNIHDYMKLDVKQKIASCTVHIFTTLYNIVSAQ